MKFFVKILLFFVLAATTTGCFRKEIITFEVQVPDMRTETCARIVTEALARIDGVKATAPDVANRTVAVTYDSTKLARKNIEFVIAGTGFQANDQPAKQEARAALAPECRESDR